MSDKYANKQLEALGEYGGRYVSNTAAATITKDYNYFAIQIITDAVLTATGNIEGLTAISLTAGTIIYGKFTTFTLTSGSVIAYYGVI